MLQIVTPLATPIYIGNNILADEIIKRDNVVVITDDIVGPLYANMLPNNTNIITIRHGEKYKTRATKAEIEDKLLALKCKRDTCIVALGGGVVTDLAGFVAATYYRGIDVIYVPTTLLAMVDAAIGGKTAVNTADGKNLIGTITQPKAILIDLDTLQTLPETEYRSAFAEIIKHGLIADVNYFEFIYNNAELLQQRDEKLLFQVIKRSCEIKAEIVALDVNESKLRKILNLGHTIGHALEYACDYNISHGQAVAIGIVVESFMANNMGLLSNADFTKIKNIIELYKIPLIINREIRISDLKNGLLRDKKQEFILLEGIGRPCYVKPNKNIVDQALEYVNSCFFKS